MPEIHALPLSALATFADADDYVESLLSFITSHDLFQKLCGGVHILDFLTQQSDLYTTLLPNDWKEWFQIVEISDVLDLLMREDSKKLESMRHQEFYRSLPQPAYDCPLPPPSLLDYILSIRRHALDRSFTRREPAKDSKNDKAGRDIPRHVAVGMKAKKIHEVQNFAQYIENLVAQVEELGSYKITHFIDFGSGQNYLGRVLASPPYCKKVIALESKQHNIDGAKVMDVTAKLTNKEKFMRNKKQHRQTFLNDDQRLLDMRYADRPSLSCSSDVRIPLEASSSVEEKGSIQYIETLIHDGNLSDTVTQIKPPSGASADIGIPDPQLMVISLHSCGNLLHHGLRSLTINPAVKAVAMVGCCYNLVTERLGPPTYKIPSLRRFNQRLEQISSACDPHGFPMSEKLASYQHQRGHGIRLNITARMMAVQAPENWTSTECESFFTRHFYRALLQRILLDRRVVGEPIQPDAEETSPRGWTGAGPALTIGSLRKACYTSFIAYVRGATNKLAQDPQRGTEISGLMEDLTDDEIIRYEEKYRMKKKELSIVWSLMAFSASVVESTMVVDRWLYLREQEKVKDCWVETVFNYKQSPRNLVVVGIKS